MAIRKKSAKNAKNAGKKSLPGSSTDVLRDGLGAVIPACVADTFADPAFAAVVDRIKAVHAELHSIERHVVTTLERKSEYFPFVQIGECAESLLDAADRVAHASAQIANGLPFCVCPHCRGEGCDPCRGSGYWTRHRHDYRHQYGD